MSRIEAIVGRYVRFPILGRECRIYFEEAGKGLPLVCLHTAASDSRQYRHLMTDPAITDRFRVMAFDLPWHGKSTPPEGWQNETYRLTMDAYLGAIRGFCQALQLDRPVVMGCSIGGRVILELAIEHRAEFGALIGLETSDFQVEWTDLSWTNRPDVHGGLASAASVSGMIAPQSPEVHRWETLWMYMQSGPGTLEGDRYFYNVDLRERVRGIDTAKCPIYLLTGEYDYTVPPRDTISTAEKIPGARVTVMKRLGHFPMSENPELFRTYIMPVLDDIHGRTAAGA